MLYLYCVFGVSFVNMAIVVYGVTSREGAQLHIEKFPTQASLIDYRIANGTATTKDRISKAVFEIGMNLKKIGWWIVSAVLALPVYFLVSWIL